MRALLREIGFDKETIGRMIEGDLKEVPHEKLNGRTPRHMMQTLGTEWGQVCMGKEFWINIAVDKARHHTSHGRDVVIDDMRFPHEFVDLKHSAGALMVRVVRDDAAREHNGHPSEGLLDDETFDVVVHNNGTLGKLQNDVRYIFDREYPINI